MTTLYQLDTAGNTKIWKIDVIKYKDYSEIVVESGRIDGKLVKNISRVMSGKNEGKANETNHYTQAVSEMESTIKTQIKKGYVYELKDVKSSSVLGSGMLSPMLAHKYHPTGDQKGSKTLDQMKIKGKKIVVQFKLDGNRCSIKKLPFQKPVMYSARSGDVMPVQLTHIIEDVESCCSDDSEFILDGELYSNKFSFNKLNGMIKRVTVNEEDVLNRKHIKFHLYDAMLDEGYEIRKEFIKSFASENIEIVPSHEIIATDENINKYLEEFLKNGYEGLMIRLLGLPYDHRRSWQLVKVKIFEDEEFELIGMEEDKRGGFVGAFVVKDKDGIICKPGASGQSEEERSEMWLNQEKYIGKMATVCFFGRSEYNVPRFPKFKGIRE